ncbi:MAG: FkbM family methyltransferase [Nitrospirota bacterium]
MVPNASVFDIGMYDGTDTAYYLVEGFRVISVEANPQLVAGDRERFASFIQTGRLIIENVAISDHEGTIEMYLSGQDLGSSSIDYERVANRIYPAT